MVGVGGRLLQPSAKLGKGMRAPDEQRGDRPAVMGEGGGEVVRGRIAVQLDPVSGVGAAEELDADAVLVAPEARERERVRWEAEHRSGGGHALAGSRFPMLGPRVSPDARIEREARVAGREHARDYRPAGGVVRTPR